MAQSRSGARRPQPLCLGWSRSTAEALAEPTPPIQVRRVKAASSAMRVIRVDSQGLRVCDNEVREISSSLSFVSQVGELGGHKIWI